MEQSDFSNQNAQENVQKPEQPGTQKINKAKLWLMALTMLYAVSLIPAFILIYRQDNAASQKDKEKLTSSLSKKYAVAVIPVYGAIYQDSGSSFVEKGSQLIASKIKKFSEDKNIKAIVLDINSPGGSVGAVQEIYSAILKAKKSHNKPFVARFGEVSASGGYYIAAACDKIVAHPGTITGSIGVIFNVSNIEGLFKKVGIKSEAIKSGKFKDIGSMSREMSIEEKNLLQAMINDSYESFFDAVAEGRKIDREKLKELADGRIFTGKQALKAGLVDKLGDFQDAVDLAGQLGGLGSNPQIIRGRKYSLEELFTSLDSKLSLFPSASLNQPLLEYRWAGF